MTVLVTVRDTETEDKETRELPMNDYIVVCGQDRYVAHTNVFPQSGTHVVTIKAAEKE